jgi:hypothetical protein
MLDFNRACSQKHGFDLIPDGAIVPTGMEIRPDHAGTEGWLRRSQAGDCPMLDAAFSLPADIPERIPAPLEQSMKKRSERSIAVVHTRHGRVELRALTRPTQPWELKEREPGTGRYRRESKDEIMQLAEENRRRLGVPDTELRSQLAGSFLGRLRLAGEINAQQFAAGERWGVVVARYARLMGVPMATPKSPSTILTGSGPWHEEEDQSEEAVARIRRDYADAYTALIDLPDGRAALAALKAAIIADRPASLGDLRCGLNALCRLWR